MLIVAVVLGIGGVAALLIGWRGRRLDDHPQCRACGYDLVGHAETNECPECGADLGRRRTVRRGRRKRRRGVLAFGSVLVVLALACAGLHVLDATRRAQWNRYKPVWLLRIEANGDSPGRSEAALAELVGRLVGQALSAGQISDLAADGLEMQADTTIPWNPHWGEFVEAAWSIDALTAEQVTRYIRTGVESSLSASVRRQARAGPDRRISITLRQAGGRFSKSLGSMGGRPEFWAEGPAIRAADRPHDDLPGRGRVGATIAQDGVATSTWSPSLDLTEGEWIGEAEWRLWIELNGAVGYAGPLRWPEGAEPSWTWRQAITFTVVPADEPLVRLIDDPELGPIIAAGFQFQLQSPSAGQASPKMLVRSAPAPENLVMDCVFRSGDREILGETMRQKKGTGSMFMPLPPPGQLFPQARTVDVVFRSNAALAEKGSDFESIWHGEFVIEDVPIQWVPFKDRSPDEQRRLIQYALDLHLMQVGEIGKQAALSFWIDSSFNQADLAFEILIRAGDQETVIAHWAQVGGRASCSPQQALVPMGTNQVTLVLRSDPAIAAERGFPDADPWEGEIVIENVPIR